jgi:integrase
MIEIHESTLLEPSWADVAGAVKAAPDLAPQKCSQWLCSLGQLGKSIDKPLDTIPARWTAARFPIKRLHHARVGMNPKTLANHKSNVRAALLWYGGEKKVPSRGMPLSAQWQHLRQQLTDRHSRSVLSPLMRYCSARTIVPDNVSEKEVDDFMRYRAETTALATDAAARRAIARCWNGCIGTIEGWPARRLIEPPVKTHGGPAWEDFPEGLRKDVCAHLAEFTRIRKSAKGKRMRPCKPSTIRRSRAELEAFARMAVRTGVPIETLTSLKALVRPEVAISVIDAYWKADGEEPTNYTVDLGWKLLSIARKLGCFDAAELERLEETRESLEVYRRGGLTEKNRALILQVLSGAVWKDVVNLPFALMSQARALRATSPVKAAILAQLAVAIAILTFAPVRLGNLVQIRLDQNLIKPGGLNAPYWLVFPDYDVKNRVNLEFPFDDGLTRLIDEYIHDFRSVLLRGSSELWLFPGEEGGFKDAKTLSGQITERIEKATGLFITVHQFRHAAAARWLQHRPGDYENVRRMLGHRNVQTTIKFYCGLETMQANQMFGDLVRTLVEVKPEVE